MVGLQQLCCNGCSNRCPLSAPCCCSGMAKAEELKALIAKAERADEKSK